MKNQNPGLFNLFIDELEDMYSSEHQIIKNLPKLIKLASLPELKEALSHHLKETEHQAVRIEKIFSILELASSEKKCQAMAGLMKEADDITEGKTKSPLLDAAIISACQKVEHYEIASYGTLRAFAKQLKLGKEVIDLLQATLDEEGSADKKLTKLAEGTLFSTGINEEASEFAERSKK